MERQFYFSNEVKENELNISSWKFIKALNILFEVSDEKCGLY